MLRQVLIVDDNRINLKALKAVLQNKYEVMEAENGADALEIIARNFNSLSAVIVDIVMPVMDGYEVLSSIRRNPVWAQIPVVVATGLSDDESREKALSLGANGYVTKPYNQALLLDSLKNCIMLREAEELVNALNKDKLTGVYNRQAFLKKAEEMIKDHEPGYYVLSCFDIDSFKVINDQYGTESGDRVLKHVAGCINACVTSIDGICCRFMADKFAVLFPAKYKNSDLVLNNHREACSTDFINRKIQVRIGRYYVEDVSVPVSSMYDRAAMAQESIKGRYDVYVAEYDEAMRIGILHEQKIISEMNDALRDGQFEPWFQPQFNHATGAMVGAEALIRWRHPKEGLLTPPGDFIPVFERNGFIYELDKYVWEQVCIVLRRLLDENKSPVPIAVNISRYDIFREDFIGIISGLVEKYGIPIELLRLEITESAFSDTPEQIVTAIKKLIKLGFTVEIDDFGSGYSSLNTLKDVPATVLKLDMKFLENTNDTKRGGSILESVARMARWLGMSVIAEGVETKAQADYLKSIGCCYIQGYLYAKPMPLSDYEVMLESSCKEHEMTGLETLETWDNNAFWDPKSMDTLIFNSYVGGACIFEYSEGKIELLRVNDRYNDEFGIKPFGGKTVSEMNPEDYLDEENWNIMLANIRTAIEKKEESTCEVFWLADVGGEKKPIYVVSTVRALAKAGESYLLYCVIRNITTQRLAERKERSISERIQAIMRHTDCGITAVVLHGDGSIEHVFINSRYYDIFGYTQEQYSREVDGPFSLIIEENRAALRTSIMALNTIGQSETFELRAQRRDGTVIWLRVAISVIKFSDIQYPIQLSCFTDITDEKEKGEQLKYLNETMLNLMNKTPGAFVQMRVKDDGTISAEYCNDGFFELVGMDRETTRSIFLENVLNGVHPDDVGVVREIAAKMMTLGEAHNVRCRLRHGRDGYIWTSVSGQMTRDRNGEIILNAYYTDATEQINGEHQQRELLDNLPYGAGLYEYDGGKMSVIHLNKRYWQFVSRTSSEYQGETFMDVVHPDDRQLIKDEIADAIRQKRDANCDIRIFCDDREYRHFNVTGHIVPKEDGKYNIYAVHIFVPDEDVPVRKLLPTALRAMTSQQNGYSFIKDNDLRYICCSNAVLEAAGLESETDIVGKKDCDIFAPDLAEIYSQTDLQIVKTGEPIFDVEDCFPTKEGKSRYFRTSKYPVKDSKGNTIGIYGLGIDITENRTMKTRMELLTNNIPGGIAVYEAPPTRPDMLRLSYFSDGFCRLFGYTREEYRKLADENPLCLILKEDIQAVASQIRAIMRGSRAVECVFRTNVKGGGMKWIELRGTVGEMEGEYLPMNAVLLDVTAQQEALEKLRISEVENRFAAAQSGCFVCRYSVAEKSATLTPESAKRLSLPEKVYDIPYAPVKEGKIAPESRKKYIAFYESILSGSKSGTAVYKEKFDGQWRWVKASYTTVFSPAGDPVSAVISYLDITEEQEKEAVYKKWQQSIHVKSPDTYTLIRCNLSKNSDFDSLEGELLKFDFGSAGETDFADHRHAYADGCVFGEDRLKYAAFTDPDTLLAGYYRGKRSDTMEYREKLPDGTLRWLRLSVDMVEYPNSSDIEAYLMYENIDQVKKAELEIKTRLETDPLTGVLNRAAFVEKAQQMINDAPYGVRHAFFMLDVDEFKRVNDSLGHNAGDRVLTEIAGIVSSELRQSDLIGRLGGDEFAVFLGNMPDDKAVADKARLICKKISKSFNDDLPVSGSIGIAMYPDDGRNFETLYCKADKALYRVKESGRDNFAFYQGESD